MKSRNKFTSLVLACLTFAFLFFSCSESSENEKPKVESLTESVYASVIVEPENFYQASSMATGIVDSILVGEGDLVKAGQLILTVENQKPQLNIQNAQAALELARQNARGRETVLQDLKARIADARMKLANDSTNFARQQRLWEKNIGSKAELERRELAFESSKNNLSQLENQLERTRNELQTQLEQAENNYQSALENADDFSIHSRVDGRVYSLLVEEGELVSPQQPLASIGSSSEYILKMRVDEVDISRVQVGQQVIVRLDAFENRAFKAEITKINPLKDQRSQTFTVEGKFKDLSDRLFPGLAGEANIIVQKKKNVLTISREYLFDENKVITGEDTLTVETGIRNLEKVEIISGIDSTTVLKKPE